MQQDRWRLVAVVLAVASLAGCSSVSQKWSQWRGKAPAASTAAATEAAAPAGLRPSTESGRWQGVYTLQQDTGRFQECTTGQTVPVQIGGDSALLETAYMAARSGPDRAMLATVDGRMLEQPVADPVLAQQGAKQLALRVERFVSLSSASACAAAAGTQAADNGGTAPLVNTYWKLVALEGRAVPRTTQEAYITLQSQGRLVGSGSCNRLMGNWVQDGEKLQLGRVAATRMACEGESGATEAALLKVLEKTTRWRTTGQRLELLDTQGKVLAVLQAVALR